MDRNSIKVNVNREELISTLEKNRDEHKEQYELAKKGFKIELRKELQKKIDAIDAGKKVELRFNNQKPDSHIGDYDEVIEMLKMSADDTIELDSKAFKQYIKNEWDWAKWWSQSNTQYFLSASQGA